MTHNFTIGELGFHKLLNDDHPYERATAPFRKEQFDAAPQVGDQSLAGWWTRGQLSFHKGAGIKYYEVLDGDEVTQRFTHSDGVTPRTPGEVRLSEEVQAATTVGPANPTVVAEGTVIAPDYSIDSNGHLYDGTVLLDNTRTYTAIAAEANVDNVFASGGKNILAISSAGAITTLYTHTRDAYGLWVAKDRLWILDVSGAAVKTFRLITAAYDPATSGAALDVTSPHLEVDARSTIPRASLAESPGGVFMSLANRIYYFGLDTTGATPTVGNAVVVGELPSQEPITALHYHLGHLVICSETNVRVAEVGDAGALAIGPSLFTASDTGRLMASHRDRVYLMAKGVENYPAGWALVTLHMAGGPTEGDLTFPWWADPVSGVQDNGFNEQRTTPGVHARVNGITIFGKGDTGTLVARYRLVDYSSATLETSGSITTGFHRFGTLDPKSFQFLRVKTEGSVGSVQAAVVLPDGTETVVGTVNAGESADFSLAAAVPEPQEYLGLKFTLTGDGTDGPTLLGYQLKALPMPKRQRLIRVPLMLFDTERGPTGRAIGAEKSAWTRLAALESLEESNALVSFEDSETGEAGTAFIETIEVMRRNGSKGNSRSNGFGGVVTITLRKVA